MAVIANGDGPPAAGKGQSVAWEPPRQLAQALSGDQAAFGRLTEPYRRELTSHCYRMVGSLQDAEDLVQETFLRAWRHLNTYGGRASFRAWLYKIATNACLDALARRPRRALPPALRGPSRPDEPLAPPVMDPIWLEPFPDELLAPAEGAPEARYELHESISLAFLASVQLLPPRQRCALLLCDVLDWSAREVAELLDVSVASVSNLLYRARLRMSERYPARSYERLRAAQIDKKTQRLLRRYVMAWESADVDGLVSLLKEDATFPMPPLPMWYKGRPAIRAFVSATILAGQAGGRWRLLPVRANAQPGFGWYRLDEVAGVYRPYAIQVITIEDGLIGDVTTFGFPNLFPHFALPSLLPAV